jgi:hypothetical protein
MEHEEEVHRKLHNILRRSITQFKLKKPMVTNYMIQNLDYLIRSFCYFSDIGVVAEYFLTDNTRFNFAFYRKIRVFMQIIAYDDEWKEERMSNGSVTGCVGGDRTGEDKDDEELEQQMRGMKVTGTEGMEARDAKEKWIRESRRGLFGSETREEEVLPRRKEAADWTRAELRKFEEAEYFDDGVEFNATTVNTKATVLSHFFSILVYHYRAHADYLIEVLDRPLVIAILSKMDMEPALELLGVLLGLKGINMHKLAIVMRECMPITVLVRRRYYRALRMLLETDWVTGDESESVSSDDEDPFHEEIAAAGAVLVDAFLQEESYFECKEIYDVLEILNCSSNRPRLRLIDFTHITPRAILYLKLVVGQLDLLMDEILQRNIHSVFVDLFFTHSNMSTLLVPLTLFLAQAIAKQETLLKLLETNFMERFQRTCIKYVSVDKGPRPAVDSIFGHLVYLYPQLCFYMNKYCRELLETDEWVHLSVFMDRYDDMEGLKYRNDEVIEGFLDQCVDESYIRYVCRLLVEDMPFPNIFGE